MLAAFFLLVRSAAFVFAVAAAPPAAAPSPVAQTSPVPQATATALQEIGHVKATVCGEIIGHANAAISHVFRNDHAIEATIKTFRVLDFDTPLSKTTSTRDLLAQAAGLRDDAAKGQAEVKALRALEASTTDPAQKQGLVAFANALSGVLARQVSVARTIDGFLQYYGYQDPSEAMAEDDAPIGAPTPMGVGIANGQLPHSAEMSSGSVIPTSGPEGDNIAPPFDPNTPALMASERADDLVKVGVQINDDEAEAGKHSQEVMAGC